MIGSIVVSLALLEALQSSPVTPGQLISPPQREGEAVRVLPLKSTDVTVDIAGLAARVTIVQTFTNPYWTPIEAVYTFPMRSSAAVNRMRMKIGERIIEGEIKRAEEARRIYEAAKAAGQAAALLDQERPNIFTQSVANIMPGEEVRIEISYVDVLDYEDGEYEFVFPMVVGPRNAMNAADPNAIVPPIIPKATRTGSNISIMVKLDAGADLDRVTSQLHAIDVKRRGLANFEISLARKDEIPNRDFILNWRPGGDGLQESFLTHATGGHGSFCLTILPPRHVTAQQIQPREVIFVIDQSGSQSGFPLEKSKELTLAMIDTLRPEDRFNVVTFTTGVDTLWPEPVPNNRERVNEAKQFIQGLVADGGTDFIPALTATIKSPPRDGRLRLIVFNTDGYVGDDFAILNLIKENRDNARLFTFGIGNSVNRFLIDGMSAEGRGGSEIVTLGTDVGPTIDRFIQRTQSPILTDVHIQVEGGRVHDLTPELVPDLFSYGPLVVFGRYEKPGPAKITIVGKLGGKPWTRTIDVNFPIAGDSGSGITTVWARKKLDDMMREDWMAGRRSLGGDDTYEPRTEAMIRHALKFGIMSQWTSFVAVEKRVINIGGKQRTVRVPVEMADGVSMGGTFDDGLRLTMGAPAMYGAQGVTGTNWQYQRGTVTAGARRSQFRRSGGGGVATRKSSLSGKAMFGLELSDLDMETGLPRPEFKIHKDIRDKKSGKIEVQVLVSEWPEDWKKLLKEAGFKLEDSDEGLKVVFGTIDAKMLLELAKLEFVTEIRPLED
ncbi:MAG: VWA domain-containing protein [Armatimonadetes bacterium]|nr:VWA domain-containing protein [Armatimonadota bacterium]